jgi:hypothetical protein
MCTAESCSTMHMASLPPQLIRGPSLHRHAFWCLSCAAYLTTCCLYRCRCCCCCCCCRGSDPTSLPTRFAWLVGGLLLHGHLLLQQLGDEGAVADAAEYVGDMRQLQLGPSNSSPEDEPVALVSAAAAAVGCVGSEGG